MPDSTSSFDPNEFMQQTVDTPTEGLQTEMKLCPEGEFRAMIDNFDAQAFERFEFTYQKGPQAGMPGSMTKLNLPFKISDDPRIQEALGRAETTVRKSINLDFKEGTNQLDFGTNRNLELNRVRAAVGQDQPGPWTFSQLGGAGPVMIRVVHRTGKRKDGTDFKVAEVDRVVAIR